MNYNCILPAGFLENFRVKIDPVSKQWKWRGEDAISTTTGLVGLLALVNRRRSACLALVCRSRGAGSYGRKRSQGEHGSDQYG